MILFLSPYSPRSVCLTKTEAKRYKRYEPLVDIDIEGNMKLTKGAYVDRYSKNCCVATVEDCCEATIRMTNNTSTWTVRKEDLALHHEGLRIWFGP